MNYKNYFLLAQKNYSQIGTLVAMAHNKKLLRRRKEHREIYEMINVSNVTVQVLDARFPQRCRSKTIENFAKSKNRQLICCINKTDLVPHEVAEQWKKIISKDFPTVFMSAAGREGTSFLRQQIRRYAPKKEAIVCVLGFPNVGKSSLINVLKGKKSAPTSPIAGFTRHLRTVRITSTLELIDTPGIAPNENLTIEEEVFLGTISPEAIDNPDIVCSYIFNQFKEQELEQEIEKYLGISIDNPIDEILGHFARRRGLLSKNAEPRIEQAARIIIRDFQQSKIHYYEKPPKKAQTTDAEVRSEKETN